MGTKLWIGNEMHIVDEAVREYVEELESAVVKLNQNLKTIHGMAKAYKDNLERLRRKMKGGA